MDKTDICLFVDKEGNVIVKEIVFSQIVKDYSQPIHFKLEDYHEPPKYGLNQDYYD